MSKVYTYKFPYLTNYTSIKMGMPVSLDEEGNVWPGAGFTLYRDSSYAEIKDEMKHVKTRRIDYSLCSTEALPSSRPTATERRSR